MGCPPPSPPAKSAGFPPNRPARPPRSTVDPKQKQELLAKLKASTASKTTDSHCFKVPALPNARPIPNLAPPSDPNATTVDVRVVPPSEARSSTQVSKPVSKQEATAMVPLPQPPATPSDNMPQPQPKPSSGPSTAEPSTATAKVPQLTEDEAIVRDHGYRTPEEIELHKRVNKHVNGYLKKNCAIKGGVKVYTKKEAWKVSSRSRSAPRMTLLTPLDRSSPKWNLWICRPTLKSLNQRTPIK
jgi:hypothetical protein